MTPIVIGGGPAGCAAAYELARHGAAPLIVERLDQVGGLSRTVAHGGCRFDIGPHRFFTKNEEVQRLFEDVVAEDAVRVDRLTRILYQGKFFDYPLTPLNALFGVGPLGAAASFASYGAARLRRPLGPEPANFEEWLVDRFGDRLYRTFFKTYTEKVWGIPCARISRDWAEQRIKALDLKAAIREALAPRAAGEGPKSLVREFLYPRLGAGQLYEKMAAQVVERGGAVELGTRLVRIEREGWRVRAVVVAGPGGERTIEADPVLSSAPLTRLVEMLDPPPPEPVRRAAAALRYREHVGVHLHVVGEAFLDNWIYVHSPEVRMARIANYRRFSAEMADRPEVSPLTVEYFCFAGDATSRRSDAALVDDAVRELETVGLIRRRQVEDAFVLRSAEAYPVIEQSSEAHVRTIKEWLDRFENLLPIGRSGMFKYNNQDHAIYTGLLAARTTLGLGRYDPWKVNIEAEYHEEVAPASNGAPSGPPAARAVASRLLRRLRRR